jgi:hypothetical protein
VDLEEFYNADPRRRHSEELEFGRDWSDDFGGRCEISWVEATGEVYAMREPSPEIVDDYVGGKHLIGKAEDEDLVIDLLGVVEGRDAIAAVMSGWEQAMPTENSLDWVRRRVENAASELSDPPATPSDEMPSH